MNVHIVGGVGRVHAIVCGIAKNKSITKITCAPGNAGISLERLASNGRKINCIPVAATDIEGQLRIAEAVEADFTIASEDDPLALGIVDRFEVEGLTIWGPNQEAARFESSKIWTYEFMVRHGIPTPEAKPCYNTDEAIAVTRAFDWRCAVKADGLALGKGALICRAEEEARDAIRRMFGGEFGEAGKRVLIQRLVEGQELSLHFLCDGERAIPFPSSKDHKRACDGDTGLNTGGMGTYSPSVDVDEHGFVEIAQSLSEAWLKGCKEENIDFRGILYPGVMLTKAGPVVLEFNARFGDPETQVYLTRLESDLLELLERSQMRCLFGPQELRWSKMVSVCVIMAAPGYPGKYEKGKVITGLDVVAAWPNVKVFHAGTAWKDGRIVTNGGRVLGVTAWAENLLAARMIAYRAVKAIQFQGGAHFRRDIGGPPIEV